MFKEISPALPLRFRDGGGVVGTDSMRRICLDHHSIMTSTILDEDAKAFEKLPS